MASTQPAPARQDSEFTDDIEKKLGYVDNTITYSDDASESEELRLKQAEELEV